MHITQHVHTSWNPVIQADQRFFAPWCSICSTSFRRCSAVPEGLYRLPWHGRKHPTASELLNSLCGTHPYNASFSPRLLVCSKTILLDRAQGATLFLKDLERYSCVTFHMADSRMCCGFTAPCYWRKGSKLVAEMELPRRRNCTTSHTMGKEECPSVLPSEMINLCVVQSAKATCFMRSREWILIAVCFVLIRVLERNAPQEDSAPSAPGYRKMTSSS